MTLVIFLAIPTGLRAQPSQPTDTVATSVKPPTPFPDFSGIVFANYQYRTDEASRHANKFDVERAYLTFRMPAGARTSVRITTDLYQQTASGGDAFYKGWSVRAKYAYLQYDYLSGPSLTGLARIGLIPTVFVEHDEQYWPRWLGNSPTEKAGYFSSADAGIATSVNLPRNIGNVYVGVMNGPGYTSREIDRFKDISARLTVTPWVHGPQPLRGVAVSAWGYKGALASRFANGGPGQIGTVGNALARDRWGIHVAAKSHRAILAAQYARRIDEGEIGSNTSSSPRFSVDSTGNLTSAYAQLRPLSAAGSSPHPLSLIARWDRVTTNTDTRDAYDHIVGGVIWDFSSKASIAIDYQESSNVKGSPIIASKGWYAHLVAKF